MKRVTPKVFVVGTTSSIEHGLKEMLTTLEVPDWETDAISSAEELTEVAGKLCYMSFDTSLNENLTKTGTRNNFDYIQDGLIKTKHGCYDSDTEVLTSEGWKYWPDITGKELLATRRPDGGLEYHKPLSLISAPYSGRMFRVEARGVDLLVTDNHNMLVCPTTTVSGRRKENFELIKASDLGHVSHAYVKTALWDSPSNGIPEAMMELLGFAIGDGFLHGKLKFHLRKSRKITYLSGICSRLGLKMEPLSSDIYAVKLPDEVRNLFSSIYDEERRKVIPQELFLTSSKSQLEALLCGLMQSDGTFGLTGDSYDTTSPKLVGQIQQLCLHVGLAANVCYTYEKDQRQSSFGDKPLTRLSIISRELTPEVNKFSGSVGKSFWVDDWEGMVYCAEVPNNTLYVRRNGIPVWCGNSVLEHTWVNLVFLDVSRVLTHELVRHGEGTAFSQESGRYVRSNEISIYIPPIISEDPALLQEFIATIGMIENQYLKLVELSGLKEFKDFSRKKVMTSALRRVLPEGRANAIFFSANHRAMRHIIEMRTSLAAEEEIRVLFYAVFVEMRKRFPAIYADGVVHYSEGRPYVEFGSSKV